MDINKEREAFELALISKRIFDKADFENYMVFNADQNKYTSSAICTEDDEFAIDWANVGWRMWCEAKEQATPEGFVLVPKEPTLKMSVAYEENAVAPCSSLSVSGYKAMIEAQEQNHE